MNASCSHQTATNSSQRSARTSQTVDLSAMELEPPNCLWSLQRTLWRQPPGQVVRQPEAQWQMLPALLLPNMPQVAADGLLFDFYCDSVYPLLLGTVLLRELAHRSQRHLEQVQGGETHGPLRQVRGLLRPEGGPVLLVQGQPEQEEVPGHSGLHNALHGADRMLDIQALVGYTVAAHDQDGVDSQQVLGNQGLEQGSCLLVVDIPRVVGNRFVQEPGIHRQEGSQQEVGNNLVLGILQLLGMLEQDNQEGLRNQLLDHRRRGLRGFQQEDNCLQDKLLGSQRLHIVHSGRSPEEADRGSFSSHRSTLHFKICGYLQHSM